MDSTLDKQRRSRRRSRLIVIGSVVTLAILIAIGVSVGVVVSRNNNNKNRSTSSTSSGSSSSGSGSSGGSSGSSSGGSSSPALDDPNDPSKFSKDPNLKKVMWAMAYTPDWALPDFNCANKQETVIKDIQLLSQLTSRIRLYGGDCNQTAMVLEAIKVTKVDMQVYTGIYVVEKDDDAYTRQRDAVLDAIKTYGTKNIAGITVGNEFILNYLTDRGASTSDGNSATGEEAAKILIPKIQDTRDKLNALNLDKTIPIGNSEAGFYFNNHVLEQCDYGLSNVHAWFAGTTAADSAGWVANYFQETNVVPAALLSNKPKMFVSETGWPTDAGPNAKLNAGGAEASVANLQIFIDNWVCQANKNGTGYFFFEFIDEQWKENKFPGTVESHWGLFDKDYKLKDIKLPDCLAS
ncbi:glycoside hydrolase family 17 protein [Crepidotus variabilis]|uniref:glucan endo-1,3-beta-D-glucosidase n=1 Tax=Crepidotus variabilis TaxID=179855 RepID=A0A9P6JVS1_9AGAR|nr:glycoside hydrolase family 17 protein [Crepidotus variabilis]